MASEPRWNECYSSDLVNKVLSGLTNLHLNIQYAYPPFLRHILYGLNARPVVIPSKLCMLNEPPFVHQLQERFFRGEVVLAPIDLARTGRPRCVYKMEK